MLGWGKHTQHAGIIFLCLKTGTTYGYNTYNLRVVTQGSICCAYPHNQKNSTIFQASPLHPHSLQDEQEKRTLCYSKELLIVFQSTSTFCLSSKYENK